MGLEIKGGKMGFEDFIRIVLWIVFFALALGGVYFLIKGLGI